MYTFLKWFLRTIFAWPLSIDVVRHDHKVQDGKIFAANHPSTLDPLMMFIVLDESVSALITQSVFNIPFIGYILKRSGHIPVAVSRGRDAFDAALKKLQDGGNILIFPEGRLSSKDGDLSALYSGAVRLSLATGMPIIPIGISYTKDRAFQKEIIINDKLENARFYLFGKYNVTFGKPIFLTEISDDFTPETYHSLLLEKISQLAEESAMRLYSR